DLLVLAEGLELGVGPDHVVALGSAWSIAPRRGHERHLHQAVRLPEGERPKQRRVDHAEDRGVGSDPHREREDGDQREGRLLAQHPYRVAQIGKQEVHGPSQLLLGLRRRENRLPFYPGSWLQPPAPQKYSLPANCRKRGKLFCDFGSWPKSALVKPVDGP